MWTKFGRAIVTFAVILVLLVGAGGYVVWDNFVREVSVSYDSLDDTYKYGSLGIELQQGMPYWIWLILPRLFPEYLPSSGGYTSLGMVWENGQELPVGFSKKTIGYPRVSPTCAACHTATARRTVEDVPTLIPVGSVNEFDWNEYINFLNDSATDPRFTADYLLNEISYNHRFSWLEKLFYRYQIIPQTKQQLLEQPEDLIWTESHPDRGRT